MSNNSFIKCGIDNDCLNKCIYHTLEIYKIHITIITNITAKKEIDKSLITSLKHHYDLFAKDFFSKKTVDCLKKHCKNTFPNVIPDVQKLLHKSNYFRNQVLKHYRTKHNRTYILILETSIEILHDFANKYQKKYLEIK